jgi:hypothetical protein
MTINFHDPVNHNGLFDEQGHAFNAQSVLQTAAQTTVPTAINGIVSGWKLLGNDPTLQGLMGPIGIALASWQAQTGVFDAITGAAGGLLQNMVKNDLGVTSVTLTAAIEELIDQMLANSQTVKGSTVTVSASATAGNAGNGVIVASAKRGDGLTQQNAYNETLGVSMNSGGITPQFTVTGNPSVPADQATWPGGSGVTLKTPRVVDASNSMVPNGSFDVNALVPNLPDGWIVSVGTVGTTILVTKVCVQQIVIGGTPTSGYYIIAFTDKNGVVQSTGPIAFNATAGAVQAALRLLNHLASVTVSSTGTSPNLTLSIKFTGYGGVIPQVTVTNFTNSGTFTISTPTAGTGLVFNGSSALQIHGTSVEHTEINVPLINPVAATPLALSAWLAVDFAAVAGQVAFELVNGIGGSVINDQQGNPNSVVVSVPSLTGTFQNVIALLSGAEPVFRLPSVLPATVYLRIRLPTPVSSTTNLFVDQLAVATMNEVYAGGPFISGFNGSAPFAPGDSFSVAVSNNRAGKIQEWYNRNLGMAALELLLPSVVNGSETIPDSLIS